MRNFNFHWDFSFSLKLTHLAQVLEECYKGE